ncbi:MAG: DUF2452 domain-containing protein [Bacteroidia bacterium]|nr:DUF2452 domain-containing protein [Bacteroidia bacterium]
MNNPIDKDKTTEKPGLIDFPHHIGSAPIIKNDPALIKNKAMSAMIEQTNAQWQQIQQQLELLKQQAEKLKKRIEFSEKIYNAQMSFEPVIGHHYYLYYNSQKNIHVLMMIRPDEWRTMPSYLIFECCVKLLADHTWDIVEPINT